MEPTKEIYQEIYDTFISKFNRGLTTPVEAGETLARIAGIFPNYNNAMVKAERVYSIVRKGTAMETDDQTGKAISSTKADTISEASNEAFEFKKAKAHCQNVEALIAALKFLQRSLEVEFTNSNL